MRCNTRRLQDSLQQAAWSRMHMKLGSRANPFNSIVEVDYTGTNVIACRVDNSTNEHIVRPGAEDSI